MSSTAPDTNNTGQFMTDRARMYLWILTCRHLLLGLLCIFDPLKFTSPSYWGVLDAIPYATGDDAIQIWGVGFTAVGVLGAWSLRTGRAEGARTALQWSVIITLAWLTGFILSALYGDLAGWSGPVVWAALAAKDLTMIRDPLRNPFEDIERV